MRLVSPLVLLLLIGQTPPPLQSDDSKGGKGIYLRGVSSSGSPITARIGNPPSSVDGSLMACVNCHGSDGKGNREGGVTASNITWEALTKPYGLSHDGGRTHGRYTERLLVRAIALGIDPAGNKLHVAMPRFQMSREDMAELVAYLKRLGKELDPGLSETTITLGTVIPGSGPLAERGRAAASAMAAYFSEVNRLGGIYNRKVELQVLSAGEGLKPAVETLIDRKEVFAIVGAFIAGADDEVASICEEGLMPMIGPTTLFPDSRVPPRRHIFYLLPGLNEQALALVRFAAERTKGRLRIAVAGPTGSFAPALPELVEEKCRELGLNDVTRACYSSGDVSSVVSSLNRKGVTGVFFLGSGRDGADFAAEAAGLGWKPHLFLVSPLTGADGWRFPAAFSGEVFMSVPSSPSDYGKEGLGEFLALARKHALSKAHTSSQLAAVAAAKVLVAALRLVGRELSREKLVTALEGLYDFETGLTPRISFGPNKRIGALGAYVVGLKAGRQGFSSPVWVPLD